MIYKVVLVFLCIFQGVVSVDNRKKSRQSMQAAITGDDNTSVQLENIMSSGTWSIERVVDRHPALHIAVQLPHAQKTEILLGYGANVDKEESFWRCKPLHFAYSQNASILIKHGANIGAKDLWGETPLHRAVRYNDPEKVTQLLRAGADVNTRDKLGRTPLMSVACYDALEHRYKIFEILLQYGADHTLRDRRGQVVLDCVDKKEKKCLKQIIRLYSCYD